MNKFKKKISYIQYDLNGTPEHTDYADVSDKIIAAVAELGMEVIGEDEITQGDYVEGDKFTWLEAKLRNGLRAEQREKLKEKLGL